MRAQEAILRRISELEQEAANDDLPQEVRKSLQAQAEILRWVVEGDRLPEEYFIEGQLKMSGEFFQKTILAGVDGSGSVFPADSCEEPGEYVLARRPTPQEWQENK